MINPFSDIQWNPSRSEIRKFGCSLLLGGLCLSTTLFSVRYFFPSSPLFLGKLAKVLVAVFVLGAYSAIAPRFAKPVYLSWFFLAATGNAFLSNFLLLLFYFCFFTPISMVLRIVGHDPLRLKAKELNSNWVDHQTPRSPIRYYRQF